MQIHVRAPLSLPPCLSSYRAGFVNPYSSVRVRPGAPVYGDHDVISSITPREGVCAGANPVGHPKFQTLNQFTAFPAVRWNGSVLRWFNSRFDSAADSESAPWLGDGRNPTTVRSSEPSAQAQPESGSAGIGAKAYRYY